MRTAISDSVIVTEPHSQTLYLLSPNDKKKETKLTMLLVKAGNFNM